ncbi:MAG TPA: helix-turn-helix domain-containing protein [Ruania sp.]|nr:helix-turn-helix domain-containing protein [Ruania sp.]
MQLLGHSLEGIASNILASRLTKLVEAGLLTRNEDPSHRQKVDYRLTEAAIELIPVLAQLGRVGQHAHVPTWREAHRQVEASATASA